MPSEREKMLAGELYDPLDAALTAARRRARLLSQTFNAIPDDQPEDRRRLLSQLLGSHGEGVWIEPDFFCDYGSNITLGHKVFFNFNCVILDVAEVKIGDYSMFGPMVQLYTATHPLGAVARRRGLELGKPITIGADVWVGGGAIVCPGVTIGDRAVIGAGSVVTREIPPGVFAAGNPCRVIRTITEV